MSNNCMFQYGTDERIIYDTELISQDAALELFNDNVDDFKTRLVSDENPEMVIWINCKDSCDYMDTLFHWDSHDFKVIDGDLYQKVA